MFGQVKVAWTANEEEEPNSPAVNGGRGQDDADAVHPFRSESQPHPQSANPMAPVNPNYSLSADGAQPKRNRSTQRGALAHSDGTTTSVGAKPPLLPPSVRALNEQLQDLTGQLERNGRASNGCGTRVASAHAGSSAPGPQAQDAAVGRSTSMSEQPLVIPAELPVAPRRSATPPAGSVSPQRRSQNHGSTPVRGRSPRRKRANTDHGNADREGEGIVTAELVTAAPRRTASPKTRDGRIKVVVRKRPLNAQEGDTDCLAVDAPQLTMSVTKQRLDLSEYTEKNSFSFDDVFDELAGNETIYKSCAQELLSVALNGGSASCFAYGQTGSGKTYTMMGGGQEKGLYLLAAHDLFERASANHTFSVGFYEIYCNSLFDLLNRRAPVIIREDGNRRMNLRGLSWNAIQSPEQLWSLVSAGLEQRVTGSTSANERSSRSHAVLSIRVADVSDPELSGMLNFVDLAGSERAADTANNDKQTRLEGAEINKSLLALKECIRSLDEKKKHVPFRGSKLTEVLRDSFTGNSKTLMIANVSPSSLNSEHTANTLRYAFRVKGLSIATVAPSKERNAPRPAVRSRSAQAARAAVAASGETDVSPSASPSKGEHLHGSPAHKKRRVRSRVNPNGSPSAVDGSAVNEEDELVCEELSGGDDDGMVEALVPSVDLHDQDVRRDQLEYRLKKTIMAQLQRDLGREIQQVLDERDAIIASLRQENEELRSRLAAQVSPDNGDTPAGH